MLSLEELFCQVDDFCQKFEPVWHRELLTTGQKTRKRSKRLSKMITIIISLHQQGYRAQVIEETLELIGFESQIHERADRNHPLMEEQKASNRTMIPDFSPERFKVSCSCSNGMIVL